MLLYTEINSQCFPVILVWGRRAEIIPFIFQIKENQCPAFMIAHYFLESVDD